jgi:uncharacterized protein (DUF2141 family)
MKTLSTLITATLLTASVGTFSYANQLNVTFKHIAKQEGNLMVALYDSKTSYTGQGAPVQVAMIPATNEKVSYTFSELQSGTYAIKVFHDENNNRKMDTNAFGIPQEGYGFSNNVGKFGEPAFSEAAFDVESDSFIEIIVR